MESQIIHMHPLLVTTKPDNFEEDIDLIISFLNKVFVNMFNLPIIGVIIWLKDSIEYVKSCMISSEFLIFVTFAQGYSLDLIDHGGVFHS